MKISNIIAIILIFLCFLIGFISYSNLPDQVATHWNSDGEADDYSSKVFGVFLIPFIMLAVFLLFLLIPIIDPLKDNIQKFRGFINGLMLVLLVFFFYIYGLMLLWNFGYRFDFILGLIPLLSVLLIYIGIILPKTKRNWFVGIRTPWTLSSNEVWKKTHDIGGKLFIISGIINLIGILFLEYWIWFLLVPLIGSAAYLFVFSYTEYNKLKKHSR